MRLTIILAAAFLAAAGLCAFEQQRLEVAHAERDSVTKDAKAALNALVKVQGALNQCTKQITFNADANKVATDQREKATAAIQRDLDQSRRKLADLNAHECKAWAEQPACGVAEL